MPVCCIVILTGPVFGFHGCWKSDIHSMFMLDPPPSTWRYESAL